MTTVADSRQRYFWLIVLSLIFPYIAVGIEFGFCTGVFWQNYLIGLFVPLGGLFHAVYVFRKARYSPDEAREYYRSTNADVERRAGALPRNGQPPRGSKATVAHSQPQRARVSEPGPKPAPAAAPVSAAEKEPATRINSVTKDSGSVSPVSLPK